MKPTLLILAAGLGSRYGSLKQIDKIGPSGERIIDYSVYDAIKAGFGQIVYVIRKNFEIEFKEVIIDSLPNNISTSYVYQEIDSVNHNFKINPNRIKPWGTGHALLSAEKVICEPFAVINADDYYGANAFKRAYDFLSNLNDHQDKYALIGYKLKNTLSNYGYVSRGICGVDINNDMTSIVERAMIKKENDNKIYFIENNKSFTLNENDIVSMNMFAFRSDVFKQFEKSFISFLKQNGTDLKAEFYLPTVVNEIIKNNPGKVKLVETFDSWFGLTYQEDKQLAEDQIRNLIEEGIYPKNLWKDYE